MKLKADGVRSEQATRKPCQSDRARARLDALFASSALVIEADDILGRPRHVGDDETGARVEFAWMPLDFGDDAAGLGPASRSRREVGVGTSHFVRRTVDQALEKKADPFLRDAVGGKPDRVLDPLAFEILLGLWIGEAGVGAEVNARDLSEIARHDRLEDALSAIGAVHITGTRRAAIQVAKSIEQEQRMIAGALVLPVPGAVLLFAATEPRSPELVPPGSEA